MGTAVLYCTYLVVVSSRAEQALAGGGVGECVEWFGGCRWVALLWWMVDGRVTKLLSLIHI